MTRLMYQGHKFSPASLQILRAANRIIDAYARQGFDLTLRQLYYRMLETHLFPNTQNSYKRLGEIINHGRLAGLVPWDRIVDRTRNIRALSHWDSPMDVIEAAARSYRLDLWADQAVRVEVWIEKDALVGVFEVVCQQYDVPLFSCRGYTSQSEVWAAAQRLERYLEAGQRVVILHFGDHDPSGLDMTRDITDRLRLFLWGDWIRAVLKQGEEEGAVPPREGAGDWQEKATAYAEEHYDDNWRDRLEVQRVALHIDQVQQHGLAPNPAKDTDARYQGYREEHGDESWELDALEPTVLADLVREAIESLMDEDLYEAAQERQKEGTRLLTAAHERWAELAELLATEPDGDGG